MAVWKRSGKPDNRLRKVWEVPLPDFGTTVGWSADGSRLAAAASNGPVHLLDFHGKLQHTLSGHGLGTLALDWQPAGTILATGGQDGHVRLWDSGTGSELGKLPGGSAWVEKLAWSHDGTRLASGAGKIVRLWNARGEQQSEFRNHPGSVAALAWRPGTTQLAVATYGAVYLYEPPNPEPIRKYERRGAPVSLAWSPDGKIFAHGNQEATINFWYADSGDYLQMSGYPTKVRELAWEPTGRYLATGGGPAACVWDCGGKGPEGSTPQMLSEPDAEQPIAAMAYQRRGFLLAAASADGRISLWQPANRKATLVGSDSLKNVEVTALAWSPDDKSFAVATSAGVSVYRV